MQIWKEMPTILSHVLECIPAKDERRDKHALKKAETDEPLELVLLDLNRLEATTRIDTRMTVEMRDALQ